jgi:hypothetical protein
MTKSVERALHDDLVTGRDGDRCDLGATTPFDAVRIAQEAFGCAEPAQRIADFARFIAKVREGNALNGEQGRASARLLESTAAAAEELHAKVTAIRFFEIVDALQSDDVGQDLAHERNPLLPRRRDAEGLTAFIATLEALPAKLRRWAASNRRGRGRPRTADIVDFAMTQLLGLWQLYRTDAPTSEVKRGAFGALAMDVLTSSWVDFPGSTVKASMARLLKGSGRSAARDIAAKVKAAGSGEARRAPRHVLIVAVDLDDQIGVEAALKYAEAGCNVTLVRKPDGAKRAERQLRAGVDAVDAAPFTGTKKLIAALKRRAEPFDTVILVGFGARPGEGVVGMRGGLPVISHGALKEHTITRPEGVARLLAELRHARLLVPGARVAVVISPDGVIAQNPHPDRHLARAGMRALAGAIRDIAIDVPATEWVIAIVSEGWGRQDTGPNKHRSPVDTAVALQSTVGRLRADHHGQALELHGGLLPGLF